MASFEYVFPSIRGVQAGREYYISMCPLRLIPRIFLFDEDELKPELRAQRTLNRARVPEIARYISDNPKGYTFSSLTASIDGKVRFEPLGDTPDNRDLGRLHIPMQSRFVINDGQHRRAAIEEALHQNPDLGDETISVVFFLDAGLKRCQQMFADLNRHAIRPSPSLGLLYDHRATDAMVSKSIVQRVRIFEELTETERSTISNRSIKLFTLSGIHNATKSLLANHQQASVEDRIALAADFWSGCAAHIRDWELARTRRVSAADLRRDYIHSHALCLAALARVGNSMLILGMSTWKPRLKKLEGIDWSRSAAQWEGRALTSGRLSKRSIHVTLTANLLKEHLGIPLDAEEQQLETDFRRKRHARKAVGRK